MHLSAYYSAIKQKTVIGFLLKHMEKCDSFFMGGLEDGVNMGGYILKLNNIEIKMFPAKSGDCILLRFPKENFNILIDGGFGCTYETYLKPYLKEMQNKGERINLIVATHIDRDHISGIKKLLEENGKKDDPQIIPIDEIWFNGFRNMPVERGYGGEEIPSVEKGVLQNMAANNIETEGDGTENISFHDGNCLAELIVENGYPWNSVFSKAVSSDDNPCVSFGKICVSILNPKMEDLNNLAKKWLRKLERRCRSVVISDNHLFDSAFEGWFLYEDESDTYVENVSYHTISEIDWREEADKEDAPCDQSLQNLSSIALLIEYEGKRLLFPGDCPIFKIKDKLPEEITVVKLPHHGSGKNIDKEFIRESDVRYYLLSTDGSYGHPSKTIVGNILCYAKSCPEIVRNYRIPLYENVGVMEEL